jgi:hypothetical protein
MVNHPVSAIKVEKEKPSQVPTVTFHHPDGSETKLTSKTEEKNANLQS